MGILNMNRHRSFRMFGILCIGVFFGGILLGACGFSPVYQTRSDPDIQGAALGLSLTKIAIIEGREGQILHNLLLDRFNPAGRPAKPKYVLETELSISSSGIGTQIDATTTRAELVVRVNSVLRGLDKDYPFSSSLISSYSTSEDDYATEVTRLKALQNSLRIIVDDLRLQVATFFEKKLLTSG